MEAENQQNDVIKNTTNEVITESTEEKTQDNLNLIEEEIVIVVDKKATRLDKKNLKKLKKMSDKEKEKEKKIKRKAKREREKS